VPGFLGVVPRPFAVAIVRASCPVALDNLPNGEPGATLPVLVAMKGGFRFGNASGPRANVAARRRGGMRHHRAGSPPRFVRLP
jgi:hypothetical protein